MTTSIKPADNPTFGALTSKVSYNGIVLSAGAYANVSEPSATFTIGAPTWTQLVGQAATEPIASKRVHDLRIGRSNRLTYTEMWLG